MNLWTGGAKSQSGPKAKEAENANGWANTRRVTVLTSAQITSKKVKVRTIESRLGMSTPRRRGRSRQTIQQTCMHSCVRRLCPTHRCKMCARGRACRAIVPGRCYFLRRGLQADTPQRTSSSALPHPTPTAPLATSTATDENPAKQVSSAEAGSSTPQECRKEVPRTQESTRWCLSHSKGYTQGFQKKTLVHIVDGRNLKVRCVATDSVQQRVLHVNSGNTI